MTEAVQIAAAAVREDTAEAGTQVSNTHPADLHDDVDRTASSPARPSSSKAGIATPKRSAVCAPNCSMSAGQRLAVADRLDDHLTVVD